MFGIMLVTDLHYILFYDVKFNNKKMGVRIFYKKYFGEEFSALGDIVLIFFLLNQKILIDLLKINFKTKYPLKRLFFGAIASPYILSIKLTSAIVK